MIYEVVINGIVYRGTLEEIQQILADERENLGQYTPALWLSQRTISHSFLLWKQCFSKEKHCLWLLNNLPKGFGRLFSSYYTKGVSTLTCRQTSCRLITLGVSLLAQRQAQRRLTSLFRHWRVDQWFPWIPLNLFKLI